MAGPDPDLEAMIAGRQLDVAQVDDELARAEPVAGLDLGQRSPGRSLRSPKPPFEVDARRRHERQRQRDRERRQDEPARTADERRADERRAGRDDERGDRRRRRRSRWRGSCRPRARSSRTSRATPSAALRAIWRGAAGWTLARDEPPDGETGDGEEGDRGTIAPPTPSAESARARSRRSSSRIASPTAIGAVARVVRTGRDLAVGRDEDERRGVDDEAGAAEQRERDHADAHERRVDAEVAAEAAADAADDAVGAGALEALRGRVGRRRIGCRGRRGCRESSSCVAVSARRTRPLPIGNDP